MRRSVVARGPACASALTSPGLEVSHLVCCGHAVKWSPACADTRAFEAINTSARQTWLWTGLTPSPLSPAACHPGTGNSGVNHLGVLGFGVVTVSSSWPAVGGR